MVPLPLGKEDQVKVKVAVKTATFFKKTFFVGAGDRNRTGTTMLWSRDFKSLASACSATPAKDGGDTRIRTGDEGFAVLCLTTWLCRQINGAEDEIRTRDPRLGKAMLYH